MSNLATQIASEECPERQYPSTGIDSQTSVDKTEAFDYYYPPNAPFGPVHFTEYPLNTNHKVWNLEDLQWYTFPDAPEDLYQIVCDGKEIIIYSLIFNGKYNNPACGVPGHQSPKCVPGHSQGLAERSCHSLVCEKVSQKYV
ncbi:hypothetical protein DSO57_1033061 [Entomophthora muscae]|uniref:Uncharacterized protein n=1 Tax=Entomophthora muscae TaxID=34485 RepID=A0ACC2SP76_9FUNG|nr:hypothetical protein DSO57_1033061 [Entomophthora muscae]